MKIRLLLFAFLSAFLLNGVLPEMPEAQAQAKKTRTKKKRTNKNGKDKKNDPAPEKSGDDEAAGIEGNPWEDDAKGEQPQKEKNGKQTDSIDEVDSDSESSQEQSFSSKLSNDSGSLRRSGRMEFDERLVKGEAAKSGAVYLFKRVPRRLPGLVAMRRSYRKRIVEPVLGERKLAPAVYSDKKDKSDEDDTANSKVKVNVPRPKAEQPVAEAAVQPKAKPKAKNKTKTKTKKTRTGKKKHGGNK